VHQILLRPEVSLSGLNRCMPEQQLNLLKFATRRPAKLPTRTANVVGSDSGHPDRRCVLLEQLPHNLLIQTRTLNLIAAVHLAGRSSHLSYWSSVVTSKLAIEGHLKTGHRAAART
jgi:hypothetical protein